MNTCIKWYFFEDPDKKRCKKVVRKSSETVRCLRQGTVYCKKRKAWFCDKHANIVSQKSKNSFHDSKKFISDKYLIIDSND